MPADALFPFRLPALLLLVLLAAVPGAVLALDYAVDDFRADFSGSPGDTSGLDPAFGDTLKIAPKRFDYVSLDPVFLSDSAGNNGQAGGTPIVSAIATRAFKTAYISWPLGHAMRPVNDNIHPKANIVTRTAVIGEGEVRVEAIGTRIAGLENINDPFLPKVQQDARPPTYFNFTAEGSRYAAYWGSLDQGSYIRRATHVDAAGGGSPDTWGKYLYVTPPTVPVKVEGFGELSAAAIPGSGGRRTVVVWESRLTIGDNRTAIRREDLDAGTFTQVEFSRAATYGEDYAVAADSAGNVVVLWRENQDLWMTAYDASDAVAQPPTLVEASVSVKDAATVHWYRPYALGNIVNGRFLIAYTQAGTLHYRALAIPFGAQAFSLGAETALTGAGETANYPSIASSHNRILVAWFKRAAGGDSLVSALFDRQGIGFDPASRRDRPLTKEIISFSQTGAGWSIYHYFKAPSVAIDSVGNIAAAYDNQFWAKLSITSNFAIFHDSGSFTSKSISALLLPSPLPMLPSDSLQYLGYRLVTRTSAGLPADVDLELAVSADGTFADPGSAFQAFPAGQKRGPGSFKYRVDLKSNPPAHYTQTKVDSLVLSYNLKPRRPSIDSIRIGGGAMTPFDPAAAYSVLPRKDSVRMVLGGVDLDDGGGVKFFLFLGDSAIDSAAAGRSAPGRYRGALAFKPPGTLPSPLDLSVRMRDSSGWVSLAAAFAPEFRNRAPAETVSIVRNRGRDSSGVYRPSGGGSDTLLPAASQTVVLQAGDTATVRIRLGDPNDDTVGYRLVRNGDTIAAGRAAVADLLSFRLPADTAPPLVDTVTAFVSDPDTSIAFRFLLRPNRAPTLDSLFHASYKGRDSARLIGPFDVVRDFAADSGIQVPSALPAVMRAGWSDPDLAAGDGVRLDWTVHSRGACAQGDLACYPRAVQPAGDSLAHAFALPEEYLTVRATDATGAFTERRVKLEFPTLDTSASASFRAGLQALADDLDFILGGQVQSKTVQAELASVGNVPLQILSATTGYNDRKWLDLRLAWETPGTPPRKDSLRLAGRTDSNAIRPGSPILVAAGAKLTLTFRISSDSLRGDSVLADTLVLRTNDLSNPFIRIPIRMAYNDLPILRISHLGGAPGPSGGLNDGGLPDLLPVRSSLVFAFSETMSIPDPGQRIRIYSYLDSLKNPAGHGPVPGAFEYRRRPQAAVSGNAPAKRAAAAGGEDILADTLIFRPAYVRPSDSLKVLPRPGAFIHRDLLHIAVSNGVTDKAGNALDLRLDRASRAPSSLDTIFAVQVDTGSFRVVSTVPAARSDGWHPDNSLRIRFNRRLAASPPAGRDSVTLLDLAEMEGDSNRGIWIRSTSRSNRRYDLQFLALEDGDSTLVLRSRPKFASFDSVTVTLSGGITDLDGLTLDGNGDGFPSHFYDAGDTTDRYSFAFYTREQDFYVFPNPFRFSNPRHREKGGVTFKNINSLSGFASGREVVLRVHSMTGDLLYSSRSASRGVASQWASMDWDLRNNAGNLVGTGVYIYTLVAGERKVLKKGKVAVIR